MIFDHVWAPDSRGGEDEWTGEGLDKGGDFFGVVDHEVGGDRLVGSQGVGAVGHSILQDVSDLHAFGGFEFVGEVDDGVWCHVLEGS